MAEEILRLNNPTDEDWHGKFDSQTYVVPAGGEALAPRSAIITWFGNPDATDIDPRNRERVREFARLRVKYGVYDQHDLWDQRRPRIETYTLSGERVYTVCDDPEGKHLDPSRTVVDQNAMMAERMEALENEIQALRAAAGVQERREIAESTGVGVVPDDPSKTLPPLQRDPSTSSPTVTTVPTPDPDAPASEVDTPQSVKVGRRSKMDDGVDDSDE